MKNILLDGSYLRPDVFPSMSEILNSGHIIVLGEKGEPHFEGSPYSSPSKSYILLTYKPNFGHYDGNTSIVVLRVQIAGTGIGGGDIIVSDFLLSVYKRSKKVFCFGKGKGDVKSLTEEISKNYRKVLPDCYKVINSSVIPDISVENYILQNNLTVWPE